MSRPAAQVGDATIMTESTASTSSRRVGRHTTGSNRAIDIATHLSPLLVAAVVGLALMKAYGWIAFLFPIGPLVAWGLTHMAGVPEPRGVRSSVAFSAASGFLVGVGWIGTQAGQWFSPLSLVFPFALLIFTIALVNFVMVVVSRLVRAWKRQPFDYPWIPDRLARVVGLPDLWEE